MTLKAKPIWDMISMDWYGVTYRELPDDGSQQDAVVHEAEQQLRQPLDYAEDQQ